MRAIRIVCALLLVMGCRHQVNDASDVQKIEDALAAWDAAWNRGDIERLSSLYTADAVAMGPNHASMIGRDAIDASNREYFRQFKEENRSILEDVRVSGNLAVARGTQSTVTTPKGGGPAQQDSAKWIVVFERQRGGTWKMLWETYNSNLPCR